MTNEVALIGFGEAGSCFARAGGWAARAVAYDLADARLAAMAEARVTTARSAVQAVSGVPLVLSLVTADQAVAAARSAAAAMAPGALWCDLNSVAPDTKRAAARIVETAGGRYVDGAVLAPVTAAGLGVPVLLSGPAAEEARAQLAALGFTKLGVAGPEVGTAAAIKMIRSVLVKGLEALTAELMAAANAAGVVDEVLASLDASEMLPTWRERADYNLSRMATHGNRRAAEMEEVATTLEALGIDPVMTRAAAQRQREMGEFGLGAPGGGKRGA